MKQRIGSAALAGLGAVLACGLCSCTDWSTHKGWPAQYSFKGVKVHYCRAYLTGDYDAATAQPGQAPATIVSYYAYEKDGRDVRHGRATWWYDEGKRKAEATYVHGELRDRTSWYRNGGVREKATKGTDGEEATFHDREGKMVGKQMYDARTRKRTCLLNGREVTLEEFMAELNRRIYHLERITP